MNLWNNRNKEVIQRLRDAAKNNPQLPAVADEKESKDAVCKSVNQNLMFQINKKRSSSQLKQFEVLVWIWGYRTDISKDTCSMMCRKRCTTGTPNLVSS